MVDGFSSQTREIVQAFQRPAVTPSQKKTGLLARGARPLLASARSLTSRDPAVLDPVYIESSEKRQTEVIVMLNLGKLTCICIYYILINDKFHKKH